MRRYLTYCVCALLGAWTTALTAGPVTAADNAAPQDQAALIAVLESDAAPAEKAITCKHLAVYGSAQAVPALSKLLPDPELSSWARIALEAIPGPEADAALRTALGQCTGRVKIGVINSIGLRADAEAVAGLAQALQDADAEIASAAAVALGKIGSAAAIDTLRPALTTAPVAVRGAVAEGCIYSAEKLLAADQAAAAAALYDQVRQAEVPKPRIQEATRGAILARGDEGLPLLVEQLQSEDRGLFRIGLATARELPGTAVTTALIAGLDKATADRAPLLVLAIADRGDRSALPTLLKVIETGSPPIRIAAISVLPQLGDGSCVAPLLKIAAEADAELAEAATAALETLPGDDVAAELTGRLATAQGKARQVVIELIGRRRINAVQPLLAALEDTDAEIRAAALTALGSTVELDHVSALIARVVTPKHAEDTETAIQALRAACVRMPDREACAGKLVAAMANAAVPAQCTILEVLGSMEGETALQALGQAGKSDNADLQDTSSRLLGEWMNVDAAPVLLDLAKSAPDTKYQIRALRGYIRLVRQFEVPEPQRVAMCRTALDTASRAAEKKLVLQVMQRYPSVDMLRLTVEQVKDPELKQTAQAVALAIAQQISGSADVQQLLAQIGQKPMKVEIIKAEYGAGRTFKDVTRSLKKHVHGFPLIVLPSNSYNSVFGGDPVPSTVKQLKIQYRIDGKPGEVTLPENAPVLLPIPN